MRIGRALDQVGADLVRAIAGDLRELNRRCNPWYRQLEMRNELDELRGRMKAAEILQEGQARQIEILLDGVGRVARVETVIVALEETVIGIEEANKFSSATVTRHEDELEKVRLRLSTPVQEAGPQRPETWADKRRKLELEFATKRVGEETTDAGKSNAA